MAAEPARARTLLSRPVLSWALYDWANSAFATTVMAGFFPIFFKQFWSAGADPTLSTFRLGSANSLAGLAIALLAPLLGAIADRGGARKRFLYAFALPGIAMTSGLYLIGQGEWPTAVTAYVIAAVGFLGANVFYDSLIIDVTRGRHLDLVSAFGFSLGYLGGGLLFALNVAMTLKPQWFGLPDATAAVRLSFLTVSVWWLLFTLPLVFFVREAPTPDRSPLLIAVGAGLRQLRATLTHVRALRSVFLFLLAYWLYIDGVHTIIQMAVDYGLALGFEANSLIVALLITQFVGFPAALLFGVIGERIGARNGILIGIAVYLAATVYAMTLDRVEEFYLLAVTIGCVQGGVQSLSRSFFARLVPEEKNAEFFGFYNMVGKFAAVLGPFLTGWVALLTGSSRLSLLAIAALFVAGALLLLAVDPLAGQRAARSFDGAAVRD